MCRFTIYTLIQVHVSLYVSFDLKGHSVTSFSQYMLTIIIVVQVLMYLELVVMVVHTLPASSLLQMSYQNLPLPLPLQEVMREYLVQMDPKKPHVRVKDTDILPMSLPLSLSFYPLLTCGPNDCGVPLTPVDEGEPGKSLPTPPPTTPEFPISIYIKKHSQ